MVVDVALKELETNVGVKTRAQECYLCEAILLP